jgi:hypothetical protein
MVEAPNHTSSLAPTSPSKNHTWKWNAAAFSSITLKALCLSSCSSFRLNDRGNSRGGGTAWTVAVYEAGSGRAHLGGLRFVGIAAEEVSKYISARKRELTRSSFLKIEYLL